MKQLLKDVGYTGKTDRVKKNELVAALTDILVKKSFKRSVAAAPTLGGTSKEVS